MFEIRKNAVSKLKELMKESGRGDCLRVYIEKGCCSDNINLDIVKEKQENDIEAETEGLKYFISKDAEDILEKAFLDLDDKGNLYIEGLAKPKDHDCCGGHNHGEGDCDCKDDDGCCGGH